MAINIKELFNSDADNIRLDKVNYNFDQISANGGGPKGVKGEQGFTGNSGQKGEQGIEGPKGDEGVKGDAGIAAQLWYSDTKQVAASGLSTNLDVITPYSNDSPNSLRTRVIIGEKVTQSNLYSTTISPDNLALLNLVAPAIDNGEVSTQLSFKNDEPSGTPSDFKIFSEYNQNVGSSLKISGHASSSASGEKTNIKVLSPNDILIKSDEGGQMTFENGNTVFETPQMFTIRSGTTPNTQITPTCVFQMPNADPNYPTWYMYRKDNSDMQIGIKENSDGSHATRAITIASQTIGISSASVTSMFSDELSFQANDTFYARTMDGDLTLQAQGAQGALNLRSQYDINIKADNYGNSNSGKVSISSELPYDASALDYGVSINGTSAVNVSAKNVLLLDTTGSSSIIRIVGGHNASGRIELNLGQGNGDQKLEIRSDITNSFESIEFKNESTQGSVKDDGIRFAEGPTNSASNYSSPNYATSDGERTLADYHSASRPNLMELYTNTTSAVNIETTSAPTTGFVSLAFNEQINKMHYTKVGHLLNVWGNLVGYTQTPSGGQAGRGWNQGPRYGVDISWPSEINYNPNGTNDLTLGGGFQGGMVIKMSTGSTGTDRYFPYVNAMNFPVLVDINIYSKYGMDFFRFNEFHGDMGESEPDTSGYTDRMYGSNINGRASRIKANQSLAPGYITSADSGYGVGASKANQLYNKQVFGPKGLIPPGSSDIWLFWQRQRNEWGADPSAFGYYYNGLYLVPVVPADFSVPHQGYYTADGIQKVGFSFNYQMPVVHNSYWAKNKPGATAN
jgi:hypothetical protein